MRRRIALAALVMLTFVGASWPLQPLVTRRAQPAGAPPAGCEESLAPAATPRVIVAEIPTREEIVPVSMPMAPPSRSLREELDAAQRALVNNDRPSFDEHLRAARAIVATYPTGGERSRAEEVLWALNDASALWDAQFESPFFDETSDAFARASRYPGYADALRRSVLTDDRDRRFYPAAETRDFIARVAAERLQRLGVRGTSTPPPRLARADTSARAPRSSAASSSTPTATSTSTSTSRRVTPRQPRSSRRTTAIASKTSKPAAPAASVPSSSPDPSDAAPPAPAEPAPTAPPASASQASADAAASPVAGAAAPATVSELDPVPASTDSATTTSAPVAPEPAPPAAAEPAERRSVIVPALLILIGLGVLVVLFRAAK